jgi:ABC-type nickel/cobalt efflux system permease component RcnA
MYIHTYIILSGVFVHIIIRHVVLLPVMKHATTTTKMHAHMHMRVHTHTHTHTHTRDMTWIHTYVIYRAGCGTSHKYTNLQYKVQQTLYKNGILNRLYT